MKKMNTTKMLLSCVALMAFSQNVYSAECKEIPIDKDNMIMTTIEVEGPRGTLKVPALIDTGASISVIPESIAEGIGYENAMNNDFHTVGGKTSMKVIKVKEISFLDVNFNNVDVAIQKKENIIPSSIYPRYEHINGQLTANGSKSVMKQESAIIGMSELTKTNFSYEKGIFKICK